jgi:hypothetical protein
MLATFARTHPRLWPPLGGLLQLLAAASSRQQAAGSQAARQPGSQAARQQAGRIRPPSTQQPAPCTQHPAPSTQQPSTQHPAPSSVRLHTEGKRGGNIGGNLCLGLCKQLLPWPLAIGRLTSKGGKRRGKSQEGTFAKVIIKKK